MRDSSCELIDHRSNLLDGDEMAGSDDRGDSRQALDCGEWVCVEENEVCRHSDVRCSHRACAAEVGRGDGRRRAQYIEWSEPGGRQFPELRRQVLSGRRTGAVGACHERDAGGVQHPHQPQRHVIAVVVRRSGRVRQVEESLSRVVVVPAVVLAQE